MTEYTKCPRSFFSAFLFSIYLRPSFVFYSVHIHVTEVAKTTKQEKRRQGRAGQAGRQAGKRVLGR